MTEARSIVKARMDELHWTRAKLAREAGVDPGTVGAFLHGERSPNDASLSRMAEALGLTPGTLAGAGEELMILGQGRLDQARLGHDLTDVPAEELLVELTAKVRNLKARVADLEAELAEAQTPEAEKGLSAGELRKDDFMLARVPKGQTSKDREGE